MTVKRPPSPFEKAIADAMVKHNIRQLVVVYREGRAMRVRLLAENPIDEAGGKVILDAIDKVIADPEIKAAANKAVNEAYKRLMSERN